MVEKRTLPSQAGFVTRHMRKRCGTVANVASLRTRQAVTQLPNGAERNEKSCWWLGKKSRVQDKRDEVCPVGAYTLRIAEVAAASFRSQPHQPGR
jgi:hypothetical protein